jgi:hypothetical protein
MEIDGALADFLAALEGARGFGNIRQGSARKERGNRRTGNMK